MKVYLSTATTHLHSLARPWIDELKDSGIEISHDWTSSVLENLGKSELDLLTESQRRYSDEDLEGVRAADIFWLLIPESGGTGCWVEFGYALGMNAAFCAAFCIDHDELLIKIIVSGPSRTIFRTQADECFDAHEQAFKRIVALSESPKYR